MPFISMTTRGLHYAESYLIVHNYIPDILNATTDCLRTIGSDRSLHEPAISLQFVKTVPFAFEFSA
jgi:hypothetical protein